MTLSPCIDCGQPAAGSRCPDHAADHTRDRPNFRARYGGNRWDQLSRRARRLQPFCTDCGATDNLACDHLPSAWQRLAAGKVIRLSDVDVVCTPCNNRRGSSRPGSRRAASDTQGGHPTPHSSRAPSQPKFGSQLTVQR